MGILFCLDLSMRFYIYW